MLTNWFLRNNGDETRYENNYLFTVPPQVQKVTDHYVTVKMLKTLSNRWPKKRLESVQINQRSPHHLSKPLHFVTLA